MISSGCFSLEDPFGFCAFLIHLGDALGIHSVGMFSGIVFTYPSGSKYLEVVEEGGNSGRGELLLSLPGAQLQFGI